jgi:hypothetical protein
MRLQTWNPFSSTSPYNPAPNVADNGSGMWVSKSFGNDAMWIATNEAFRYLSAQDIQD